MQTKMIAELLQNQSKTSRTIEATAGHQQINPALLPDFEQFCPAKEPFGNYKERFENYLQMNNVFFKHSVLCETFAKFDRCGTF